MEITLKTPDGREYQPLPNQAKFHASPAKYRCYLGGFGSGKTLGGAVETLMTLLEYPGCQMLVARYTYRELLNSTWKTLRGIIPDGLIQDANKTLPSLRLKNGSEAVGWNLQNHETMTSLNLSGFWIDEACEDGIDQSVYNQLCGRLRNPIGPRKGWLTGNPGGKNWVYDLFFSDKKKRGHEGFQAGTAENKYLPPEYIKSLRDLYDDEWVERYLAGSFEVLEGQILDTFDTSLHVIEPFRVPEEWPRFRGVDHGFTNPTACVWLASDFDGDFFVYRNYYQRCSVPSQNVQAINDLTGPENIDWTVIDPSVKQTESSGERIIDQYRKAGLVCQYGDNDVKASISRIRQLLQPDEAHKFPAQHPQAGEPGSPRLFITRDCRELIWEMQQWTWRQVKPGAVNKEVPLAKHDHAIAALRYVIMRSPRPAVERPSTSAYDRFMQIAAEMAGESPWAPELIDPRDLIGNERLSIGG